MTGGRVRKRIFLGRHSLSLASIGVLSVWIGLYGVSGPGTHLGLIFWECHRRLDWCRRHGACDEVLCTREAPPRAGDLPEIRWVRCGNVCAITP